jgi:hypothetical protein
MRDNSAMPTGQSRGHQPASNPDARVSKRVDTTEDAMKATSLNIALDPVVVDAKGTQLLAGYHPMLAGGEIGDRGPPSGVPFGRYAPIRRTASDLAPVL